MIGGADGAEAMPLTSHLSRLTAKLSPAYLGKIPPLRFFIFAANTDRCGAAVEDRLEGEILPKEASLPVPGEHVFSEYAFNIHRIPNLRRFDRQDEQAPIRIKDGLGLSPMFVVSVNQEVDRDRPFVDPVVMILTCLLLR